MKKYFFLFLIANALNQFAMAKEKITLNFDFNEMSINSIGIFNPKVDGEKSGLNAELIARKNGIDNLEKYFDSSCAGLDKSSLGVKKDWENSFHSQGTEIYADGILAVTLEAPIKQIFKPSPKSKKTIKTEDGDKIVFQMPKEIPLTAIRCGTLELNLGTKKIHVIPLDSVEAPGTGSKIIHLVFNKITSNLELDPATKEQESEILDNSSLDEIDDIAMEILPISVATSKKLQ